MLYKLVVCQFDFTNVEIYVEIAKYFLNVAGLLLEMRNQY